MVRGYLKDRTTGHFAWLNWNTSGYAYYNGVRIMRSCDGVYFDAGDNPIVTRLPLGLVPEEIIGYSYEGLVPADPARTRGTYKLRSATATLETYSDRKKLIISSVTLEDITELYERIREGTASECLTSSYEEEEIPRSISWLLAKWRAFQRYTNRQRHTPNINA